MFKKFFIKKKTEELSQQSEELIEENIIVETSEKKNKLKKNSRKRKLSLAVAIICVLCSIGISMAYFSDVITTGTNGTAGTVAVEVENNINLLNEDGMDILNPGDIRTVNFTVVNYGNKSIDTKTTVALSLYNHAGFPLNFTGTDDTQSEYDLYAPDDVAMGYQFTRADGTTYIATEAENEGDINNGTFGYIPKAGARPLESKKVMNNKIFYEFYDSMNGNSDMYDEAETIEGINEYQKEYDFVLVFKAETGNDYQDSTIIIDVLAEAKQHENTELGWELISHEKFGQGVIVKDTVVREDIITEYYYPFIVSYDHKDFYNDYTGKLAIVGIQEGVTEDELREVTVPYGVQVIPEDFFCSFGPYDINGEVIEWCHLPETIEYIGTNAFLGCTNMKGINLPVGLTYIGEAAFSYCLSLTDVVIPEGIETLKLWTFMDCASLKYVSFPSTLKVIENSNFENCDSLTTIYIPDNVERIDWFTFRDCDSLINVRLPENENYTVLDDELFAFCDSLKKINIPDNVTTIKGEPFMDTILTEYAIGSGLVNIDYDGTYGNTGSMLQTNHSGVSVTLYTDNENAIDYFTNCPHLHWSGYDENGVYDDLQCLTIKSYAEYPHEY